MTRSSAVVRESTAFGRWLRCSREELGLSREAFASKTGLCASTLRNVESGRHQMNRWTGVRLLQAVAKLNPALYQTAPALDERLPKDAGGSSSLPVADLTLPIAAHLRLEAAGTQLRVELALDRAAISQVARLISDSLCTASPELRPDSVAIQLVVSTRKHIRTSG